MHSLDTWHGDACVESISPHVRIHTCEVEFVSRCGHTCGETRVDMFGIAVVLHVWEHKMLIGTTAIGPYNIVCIYGSCAADCNQEPVQAVVAQVVLRHGGFANVLEES